MPLERSVGEGA